MTEEQSSERSGSKLSNYATIGGFLLAIIALFLGSGFYYNEVYKSKILSYTILPSYDIGNQFFTGVVIENRGRVLLTEVEVILSDLESDIMKISMPGPHQSINIVKGGEGTRELHTMMPRFSQGAQLPIYLITTEPITLAAGETLFITSSEAVGKTSDEIGPLPYIEVLNVALVVLGLILVTMGMLRVWSRTARRDYVVIHSATYGAKGSFKDVTGILHSNVKDGKLEFSVSNHNLGSDPIRGVEKELEVEYFYKGKIHRTVVKEGEVLTLP